MFRTWGIFRTLPNVYDPTFCKIRYLAHILNSNLKNTKKFVYLLMFREMELSGSNIKKLFIFSQKKDFVIFRETERKDSLYFIEMELFYISGNFLNFKK